MAKIVNDTELIFEESDIGEDGNLNIKVFENDNLGDRVTKVVLPNGLKKMPYGAFSEYESLKEISIPEGVTNISKGAFRDCKSLRKIHIPDSVTGISWDAFSGCESLKEIHIPDSVTEIGECAFWGCESLKEINIPDSVTSIGEHAFAYCGSIYYKGQDITHSIHEYGSFDVIKCLADNDLQLTDDMLDKAMEAKKENRLRGFVVKTKKRLSEREIPDIDYSNSDDFNKEF